MSDMSLFVWHRRIQLTRVLQCRLQPVVNISAQLHVTCGRLSWLNSQLSSAR